MKRAAIILCVFALISAICVAALHFGSMSAADKVEFREYVCAGDIAATEGLTLRTRQSVNNQLYWNTELPVAAPGLARTEFTARIKKEAMDFSDLFDWPVGLHMSFGDWGGTYNYGGAFDESGLSERLVGETNQLFKDFILDVSRRTPPGGSSTETVLAREVSEYVPISAYLELYGMGIETDAKLSGKFARIFRFPMPERATFTVRLEKNANGQIDWLDTSFRLDESDENMAYSSGVQSISVATENKCFFALRGDGSVPLDYSDVSLGYGLYCLPWSADDSVSGNMRFAEIKTGAPYTVLPLSEKDMVADLTDAGNGRLLLILENEKGLELVVLDTDTEETMQRFTLFTPEELGGEGWVCVPLDGRLYAACDERVRFYERGADGSYSLLLDAQGSAEEDLPEDIGFSRFLLPEAAAWDGERLAVITSGSTGYIIDSNYVGGGILLLIYDASGLRYCGRIQSGAMDGEQGFFSEDAVVWGNYAYGSKREKAFELAFDGKWSAEAVAVHEGVSLEPQTMAARTVSTGSTGVIGGADGPTAIFVSQPISEWSVALAALAAAAVTTAVVLLVRRRKKTSGK
ncbi:MAG: hypothetical protein J5449_12505 [Oscillospiraceae bacterium]|nr:hypothetical protein [Oscillospiraceae bacterium]